MQTATVLVLLAVATSLADPSQCVMAKPPVNNKTGADVFQFETGPDSPQNCGTSGPSAQEVRHNPQQFVFRALDATEVLHVDLSACSHDQHVADLSARDLPCATTLE